MNRKKSWCLFGGIMVIALIMSIGLFLCPVAPAMDSSGAARAPDPTPGRSASTRGTSSTAPSGPGPDPDFPAAPVLGRPTDHSMNVNIVPGEDLTLFAEYGETAVLSRTTEVSARAGVPVNILISGLEPDTGYAYRLCSGNDSGTAPRCGPEYSFHTQRSPGSSFVFDVQADSHLDEKSSAALYRQTLENELEDKPDFLIDLGDTFMTDKLSVKNEQAYLDQYLSQRSYFDTIGHSVPLFLVLGNHDGEAGYAQDEKSHDIAPSSLRLRKMYFPNPEPDGFYTGNAATGGLTGLREDYYGWEWGDALFVVIDPYWYTMAKPGGRTDGWGWTLGEVQYRWLEETLMKSTAKYRFVFAHQLVGGDAQGRGGTEYASLYEWGGRNPDGSWGFDIHRPGWGTPIHQLLVENHVTAFFHGHDHFFAMQELDGVIYQEVPQPATLGSAKADPGAEYGYASGVRMASPGHLRVTVSPESVRIGYIGSGLPGGTGSVKNGAVIYSYLIEPVSMTGGTQVG
jgi:hypothetical protein